MVRTIAHQHTPQTGLVALLNIGRRRVEQDRGSASAAVESLGGPVSVPRAGPLLFEIIDGGVAPTQSPREQNPT